MPRTLTHVALVASFLLAPASTLAQSEDEPATETAAPGENEPRYLGAMREQMESMSLRDASCEAADRERGSCSFTARGPTSGRDFPIELIYSDRTDTVYIYVPRLLTLAADSPQLADALRQLMELNWALLTGKFEWNADDGEVRLSVTMNTDSNFDRRAFRSLLRGIVQVADRYYPVLRRAIGE